MRNKLEQFIGFIETLIFCECVTNGIATLIYLIPRFPSLIYMASILFGIAWTISIRRDLYIK